MTLDLLVSPGKERSTPAAGTRLHLVSPEPDPEHETRGAAAAAGDLGLHAMIFGVAVLPLACDAAGLGRWDPATLGLGTVAAIFSGPALARSVAEAWRSSRPTGRPRG